MQTTLRCVREKKERELNKQVCGKIYFAILALSLVALGGCTTAPTFDSKLIRQWNAQLDNDFPGQEPGLAHYQKGPYELFYLGARHENETDSATLRLVSQIFEKYKFNVLLIESIPNSSGESPQWFLGDIRDKFTLEVIESLLRKYKQVAVVYGAGHFVTLRKTFDTALGTPSLARVDTQK